METKRLILLWIDSDRELHGRLDWLYDRVQHRKQKWLPVTVEHLANCSTLRSIVSRGARLVQINESRHVSDDDKREARYQLASQIIYD